MPGIAGVIETGARLTPEAAARLVARLTAPGETIAARALGAAALGHAMLPVPVEQGGVAVDGHLLVAATGWVAGTADLAPRARPASGRQAASTDDGTSDFARFCLALLRESGAEALADLNGIYAVAAWDDRAETLVLAQDRLGAAGLCYHLEAGRLAFATRPRALLALCTPELDRRALGQLLQVGYPMGDRTLFRGIRLLGPASFGVWRRGRMLVRRTWTPPAPGAGGDESAAIEALDAALAGAVEDAAGSAAAAAVVLPLSGGLDSRTLLGYACRHGRPRTYSYGHGHSWDRRFGARVARAAGTRHLGIDLGRDFMARYGPRLVHRTEGQASIHAAHLLCLLPHLARQPSVTMTGYLGDAITGAHLAWIDPRSARAGGASGEVTAQGTALFERAYRVGFEDAALGELLRRPYAKEARGAALETFLETYASADDPVARADRVDLELRQRRFIAYQLEILGAVTPVRAPFADHRVIDTCLGWPVEWRSGQRLYRELLRRVHPDLARVPLTSSGIPLLGSRLVVGLRRQAEHCRWRLIPRLTRGLVRPHDYRQYAHYDEWIRTGARGFFTELLDDRELLDEIFDTEKVSDLLKLHLEGRIDAHQRLCAVATVGLWLRLFARGGTATAVENPASSALAS